jgi:flagellar biosynthetic protein FlhB
MAEQQDGSRTEQATARRKAEARKKGQVAISRECATAAVLGSALLLLYLFAAPAMRSLIDLTREWLSVAVEAGARPMTQPAVVALLNRAAEQTLGLLWPVACGLALAGTAAYLAQTGFLWNSDKLAMDLNHLNPLSGLGRMVSLRAVVELGKSLLKIGLITWVGIWAVRRDIERIPGLVQYGLGDGMTMTAEAAFRMLLWVTGTVALLALGDYAYQRFEWERSLRMTKQEIKQELRETEGDPLLRSRVRSLQRQMARNRMMAAVPKADVVITNPTHLAVALRYDHASMAAPVVVAKGAGYVAERIKEIARAHGVMIVENRVVARLLFKLADIGREVPVDLYRAVAEILAMVYRAKGRSL